MEPKNAGKTWTKGLRAELLRMWKNNYPIITIAAALHRTNYAIACQLRAVGCISTDRLRDYATGEVLYTSTRQETVYSGAQNKAPVTQDVLSYAMGDCALRRCPTKLISTGDNEMKTVDEILKKTTYVLNKELAECTDTDILKAIALAEKQVKDLEEFNFESRKLKKQVRDLKKCIVDLAALYDQV